MESADGRREGIAQEVEVINMIDKKKAVIFDLDGTLVNSMWVWHDIDIEYLGRYGYDVPEDMVQEIEGMGFTEVAVYFKERFRIPDEIETIKEEWNRMAFEKYATALEWCKFVDIQEAGIEGVQPDVNITEVSRYDINGRLLSAPTIGVNIVKMSDGSTKKIIVNK